MAKADEFVKLTDELAALVAAKGEDAASELDDAIDDLRATLKENISIGGCAASWPSPARSSTPTCTCRRAAASMPLRW